MSAPLPRSRLRCVPRPLAKASLVPSGDQPRAIDDLARRVEAGESDDEAFRGIEQRLTASESATTLVVEADGRATERRYWNLAWESGGGDADADVEAWCEKVRGQIAESVRLHQNVGEREAQARALEMMRLVGIPSAEKRMRDYPHQMSGGMRQRVMIAAAMAPGPELLIADEPTTALDVTVQAEILDLMETLNRDFKKTIVMVTHDPRAAERATRQLHLDKGELQAEVR